MGLEDDVFSKTLSVFADYSSHDIRCSGCKKHIGYVYCRSESYSVCANVYDFIAAAAVDDDAGGSFTTTSCNSASIRSW